MHLVLNGYIYRVVYQAWIFTLLRAINWVNLQSVTYKKVKSAITSLFGGLC